MLFTPIANAMKVTWYFGDGANSTVYGPTGTVYHTYATTGDIVVRVVAIDKDGGPCEVQFKITVKPSKEVLATPIGPNFESAYYGATGLGYGMIFSDKARVPVANRNNAYYFMYDPDVTSDILAAVPYKTAPSGYYNVTNYSNSGAAVVSTNRTLFDSFFFVWAGTDQGLADDKLNPAKTTATTVITLPDATTDSTSIEIRDVQAIFSREWRIADNMGDINQDGIPDKVAIAIETASGTATDTTGTAKPIGLTNLSGYNDDLDASGAAVGDFLPVNPTGSQGVFDFRPVSDGKGGNKFTALLEVRGYDPGLNMANVSDPDGVADEPGTDPALEDTDGDGFPDGYEFYFWYNAKFKGMTGSAYNPLDVANGTLLSSKSIELAFEPSQQTALKANVSAIADSSRDFDKDGLLDIEEMVIGTNPTQWDTDGDGICDTWEVMRGMNPCKPSDGLSALNNNIDGDYMAYASVPRQFVTVVAGGTVTNTYLALGAELGANTGTFTTWYHYGDTNAPIAVGRSVTLAANALVTDLINTNALVLHFQVLREFGFDPRTAWTASLNTTAHPARWPTWLATAVNTKPFTAVDEYLLLKFMSETRMNGATASMPASYTTWKAYSTDPMTPDSDVTVDHQDGMPDGWELYVSVDPTKDLSVAANRVMQISPWNPLDGDLDHPTANTPPRDGLINRREFGGTDSSAAYTSATLYNASNFVGVVSIVQPAVDVAWINKFWPTNPWVPDTDGDGLNDLAERAFMYGTVTDNGTSCIQGGGLNPNSVDTDLDGLPDAWEVDFTGTVPTAAGTYSGIVITNGMDGTVSDYNQDWDHDGLLNYQEYWVQAVRSFRYDIPDEGVIGSKTGNQGLPIDSSFSQYMLFTEVTNSWDRAKYPWGNTNPDLWILLRVGPNNKYVSTDPRDPDTDQDGMDDYYEMFHGLNPILGGGTLASGLDDRVGRAYIKNGAWTIDYGGYYNNDWAVDSIDFVKYPWLTGMPESDPDADGLLNFEEKLQPNTSAPAYYNTDPTPIWMTDYANPESFTYRFYWYGGMFFWPGTAAIPQDYSMYSFEMNEGYDTDNDGLSDKAEMVASRNSLSDPQDQDDPVRRQAIWFSGLNSAASTFEGFSYGEWTLRSFTAELWARPASVTNSDQVLLERVLSYVRSDLSTTNAVVRHNFRIGIKADGRVYGMFENAGSHDSHTATVYAYGNVLNANEWVHIAVRMDGAGSAFTLLVNGEVRQTVSTSLIPANGVTTVLMDPVTSLATTYTVYAANVVVGAANVNPTTLAKQTWGDYAQFYQGYVDEVRIWDGARSNDEILSNYKKRFTKNDLWNNRLKVRTEEAKGASRVWTNPLQMSAELLYHYTFDNLFGADVATSVATSPRGFNDLAVAINRPAGSAVGWWDPVAVKSTVYNDYNYVPWIENGVEHLPTFGGATLNADGTVSVMMSNTVPNSVYWTHTSAGNIAGSYSFPNNNNPYGFRYTTALPPALAQYTIMSDLLPLGDAFAKQVTSMWDEQGASGVWSETATDSDSDGLPDWWETYVINTLYPTLGLTMSSVSWDALYPDGSGMTYGERYQRDVANGATPTNPSGVGGVKQTADSDGDGMPDWWENIYNLNSASDKGDDGALGDPDRDGLSNLAEYMISEVYGFRYLNPRQFKTDAKQTVSDYFLKQGSLTLGAMFTDHDFMEDAWEDQYDLAYVSRYVYDPFSDADEDGWSNWAESRYRVYADGTRPDLSMKTEVLGLMDYEFPIPTIATTLRYTGLQTGGTIVLQTYKSETMDGTPDATYNIPNDSTTVTVKTQPLGYWADKTVVGMLSPGSVQPGSINFKFTDLWTGLSANTGFDVNGVLYSGNVGGYYDKIGTIDYVTGKFALNLSYYKDSYILLADTIQTRVDYIDCNLSFVEMSYSVRAISTWPKTVYLGLADKGYVREGTNYVFAFLDVDGSGTWNAGEPCGVAKPFALDVGWDYNNLDIELTDYTPGYLRMTLASGLRSEDVIAGVGGGTTAGNGTTTGGAALQTRVRVRRNSVDGYTTYQRIVLDKVLQSPRNYLHEGDLLGQGELGLDWGLTDVPTSMNRELIVYDVFVGDATVLTNNTRATVFTNRFDLARATAKATSPTTGKYVYSARPTFKWTMPKEYTAFALEIRKGSSSGTVIYQSGTVQAPVRDSVTGEYVWEAPICAGDKLPNGQIFASNTLYVWRVIALNSKFTLTTTPITWSSWNVFRLDVNAPPSSSGYGELRALVKYYGPATKYLSGRVKVQLFRNRGFAGVPDAQYTLSDVDLNLLTNSVVTGTNAVLRGLTPSATAGSYYVRAIIDHNQNNARDVWESWGYANYYGLTDTPYSPRPTEVTLSGSTDLATVIIEDADSDQDWFPDAWEYDQNPSSDNFLELTGPSKDWATTVGDTEVNPDLLTTSPFSQMSLLIALAAGTSDQDKDGVSDLAELILGTNPNAASSAADGYSDAAKLSIGLYPTDKLNFIGVTAFGLNGTDANLTWKVDVEKAKVSAGSQTFLSALTGVASDGSVAYHIEYTPSLLNADWQEVESGTVTLGGSKTIDELIKSQSVIDPAKGFFRVRLGQ